MRFSCVVFGLVALLAGVVHAAAADQAPVFARLAQGQWQGEVQVTVNKGDTLSSLAGRYAVTPAAVAALNDIKTGSRLKPGQTLKIHYAHLIPADLPDGITINLPQRLLFLQQAGALRAVYALGLGRPLWPTPEGVWKIVNKTAEKTWIVPKSIQAEMARQGKEVKTSVPPGPDNPLGGYWLGLSLNGYGIHGTIAPASIYHFQSHGCIRLALDDITALFSQVEPGLAGANRYWPILLEIQPDGRILLEVHPDIYRRRVNARQALQQLAGTRGISDRIDWLQADSALKAAAGAPVDITLPAAPSP